jgi:hypothetical protein
LNIWGSKGGLKPRKCIFGTGLNEIKKNDISKYSSKKIVKTCKKHAVESLGKGEL